MLAVAVRTRHIDELWRVVVLVAAAVAAVGVCVSAGADVSVALSAAASVTVVVAFSALAVLAVESGALAGLSRLAGAGLVGMFVVAAVATVLTSNDVVVVLLGPVAVTFARPAQALLTLFVAANVPALLLPQGSPTNLVIADAAGWGFSAYLRTSAPLTAVMVVVAAVGLAVAVRAMGGAPLRGGAPPEVGDRPQGRWVLALTVAAVTGFAVSDAAGVPRWAFAAALFTVVMASAAPAGVQRARVLRSAAWVVMPVVAVMVAVGQLLAASSGVDGFAAGVATFAVSSVLTDLAGAGLAAAFVSAGSLAAPVALVAVTAAAFATPFGSLSALLLAESCAQRGVRVPARVFVAAFGVAAFVAAAGVTAATWL